MAWPYRAIGEEGDKGVVGIRVQPSPLPACRIDGGLSARVRLAAGTPRRAPAAITRTRKKMSACLLKTNRYVLMLVLPFPLVPDEP